MIELDLAKTHFAKAKCPEDIFNDLGAPATQEALQASFRKLALRVHPDRWAATKAYHELATSLLRQLNGWHEMAVRKVAAGTYGDRTIPATVAAPAAPVPVTIRSGKSTFVVGAQLAKGDVCDVYRCEADGADAALKIAQHASVNDLVENEAKALRKLRDSPLKGQEKLLVYFPDLKASFMLAGKPAARRVNVMPLYSDHVSLADVKRAFPRGIDFRDWVWMFKRSLVALGYAHRQGLVHGAILPPHILVHPTDHGAKLIDWSYSVQVNGTIKAISADYRGFYPSEVLAKQPATAATDIYMLARCAVVLLGVGTRPDIPPRITSFLNGCLLAKPGHRPQDAWALHDEFDKLLQRLVGAPKYRPLIMPASAGGK